MMDIVKKFIATVSRKPVLSRESNMTEPGKAVDVEIKFWIAPGVIPNLLGLLSLSVPGFSAD